MDGQGETRVLGPNQLITRKVGRFDSTTVPVLARQADRTTAISSPSILCLCVLASPSHLNLFARLY